MTWHCLPMNISILSVQETVYKVMNYKLLKL